MRPQLDLFRNGENRHSERKKRQSGQKNGIKKQPIKGQIIGMEPDTGKITEIRPVEYSKP